MIRLCQQAMILGWLMIELRRYGCGYKLRVFGLLIDSVQSIYLLSLCDCILQKVH